MRLRTLLLMLGMVFCLFQYATAQGSHERPERSKYTFGTEIGIAYGTPIGATQKGDRDPDFDTQFEEKAGGSPGLGLHGGIFARRAINERFGLQLGLSYSRKKSSYKSPVYDQDYTYNQKIQLPDTIVTAVVDTYFNGKVRGEFNNQYLSTPLVLLYKANKRLNLHGGIYAALLLQGSHEVWASGIVGDEFDTVYDEYSDESAYISKWDYGVNAGLSYLLFRQVECELRVSTGLTSIFTDDYVLSDAVVRNLYMELKANYTFQF